MSETLPTRSQVRRDAPSPQAPATGPERRREPRLPLSEPVTVTVAGASFHCRLSDISTGGAMVEGDLPAGAGTELGLDFADFDDLSARVIYVGDGFYGTQFIDPARHRDAIRNWIHQRATQSKAAASDA